MKATLNSNAVLNNVRVNDSVVTVTSIGLKLANRQATAALSQCWPGSPGPEPMQPRMRVDRDYRDPNATRAGRSVRPAGCLSSLGHAARPAVLTGCPAFNANIGKRPSGAR
jgi:hypothetical protein